MAEIIHMFQIIHVMELIYNVNLAWLHLFEYNKETKHYWHLVSCFIFQGNGDFITRAKLVMALSMRADDLFRFATMLRRSINCIKRNTANIPPSLCNKYFAISNSGDVTAILSYTGVCFKSVFHSKNNCAIAAPASQPNVTLGLPNHICPSLTSAANVFNLKMSGISSNFRVT